MPRVGLTTTRQRGAELMAVCREEGLDPVLLPCIEFTPAEDESLEPVREDAVTVDLIVVTSPRAVTAVWPKAGMPGDVPVAAVGGSTAVAVREAGGKVSLVGDGGAADLSSLLGEGVRGRTVLFPHASGAGGATVRTLKEAGASVIARPVYEMRAIAPGGNEVDGVVFGSPTAVTGWLLSRSLAGLVVGAIGETTASALAERSAIPDVVPVRPSFGRLIHLIAEHLRDRSPA